MNAYSDSPQVYHRLQKIHGHGSGPSYPVRPRNNRCNDSAPVSSPAQCLARRLLQELLYFLSSLGLHASRDITHEFTPDHCSMHCLYAAHLRFYIPFFGFTESMGLGTPWLIIQAKNLCTSKSPPPSPSPSAQQPPYAASAGGC